MGDVTDGQRQWRVRRELMYVETAGLVLALLLVLLNLGDRRAVTLCGIAVIVLAVLIVRDLLVPVRLSADGKGVRVVRGFAGNDWLPWDTVEHVRVDVNRRYGRRFEHLEIDTGERIYVLGSGQLGMSCTEVAAELRRLRAFGGSATG